jgi:Ca2+-binding RTX toxin-like protein
LARGRDTGVAPLNRIREQFYKATGDADLRPYASWVEFGNNIKHPESLVNFIAAYGVHPLLADATTVAEKRAAAVTLVYGAADDPKTDADESFGPDTDFLNGTGAFAGVETGLNNVDLWIGGLAEKSYSSGGLLGSTFNFVFETQMEQLQSGDRFYYLSRLAGTNFLNQLEGTSFSEMVMRTTGATHLPFDVFSVPTYTIEAGDASTYPVDASGRPQVTILDSGTLRFDGDGHVVIGGTAGADKIQAGAGDDTLWGDGGDDVLDGDGGNDAVIGGEGNDRLASGKGDDIVNGDAGDDEISGGAGSDLLVGLAGQDVIGAGDGADEVFGGLDSDKIFGGAGNDELLGNEGDDWIKGGEGDDHLVGDNGNPFGEPLPDRDTALFSGKAKDYTITYNADESITITDNVGHDGTDTLTNIERLGFTDQMILADGSAENGGIAGVGDEMPTHNRSFDFVL